VGCASLQLAHLATEYLGRFSSRTARFALALGPTIGCRRNRLGEPEDGGLAIAGSTRRTGRAPVVGLRERATALGRRVEDLHQRLPPLIRRPVTIALGVTLTLAGIILLVLPGPGLLVLALGLAVLALEFRLARRLLAAVRDRLER
jgi:Putative transmembrane protein (PGPGW)